MPGDVTMGTLGAIRRGSVAGVRRSWTGKSAKFEFSHVHEPNSGRVFAC